jgi:CRP-like cAMP-binding protein
MSLPPETEQQQTRPDQEVIMGHLQGMDIFRNMDQEVMQLFAYLAHIERYQRGEVILEQGKPSDRLLLITSGEVDICQQHHDRLFHLQTLQPDGINYFGELALIAEFRWFFLARAITDVECISISREAFRKVMERFPERYIAAVDKIVNLRIKRFNDQTNYLLDHLKEEAWKEAEPLQHHDTEA